LVGKQDNLRCRLHCGRELDLSAGEYPALAVNRDGTLIAGGGMERHLRLWQTATGRAVKELPGPDEAPIMGTAFSPDGKRLVSVDGRYDNEAASCRLKLWDVGEGKEAARMELAAGCFYSVVFAADGRSCFAALHDGTVRRYSLPQLSESQPGLYGD
jgi:WD40 repeat protein